MAHVSGPLMSLQATGAIGKALIYGKNKRRNTVRAFAAPGQPNTFAQQQARAKLRLVDTIWTNLDQNFRDEWQTTAEALQMSTANAQAKTNMIAMQADQWPKASPGFPATNPNSPLLFFTANGLGPLAFGAAQVLFGIQAADWWSITVEEAGGGGAVSPVFIMLNRTQSNQSRWDWEIKGLPPGNYHTQIAIWRPNGTVWFQSGIRAFTITA